MKSWGKWEASVDFLTPTVPFLMHNKIERKRKGERGLVSCSHMSWIYWMFQRQRRSGIQAGYLLFCLFPLFSQLVVAPVWALVGFGGSSAGALSTIPGSFFSGEGMKYSFISGLLIGTTLASLSFFARCRSKNIFHKSWLWRHDVCYSVNSL